jgi:hypothetical protein
MPAGTFSDQQLDKLARELQDDGICVLRGALDPLLIQGWADAFAQLFERRRTIEGGLAPRETERYYLTLPWREPFADERVFAHPAILGVLDRLFDKDYVMVQLGADVPLPGAEYQEVHRDFMHIFPEEVITPIYAVAVNFPLVKITDENGPFQMARKTHKMTRAEGLKKIETGELEFESFYADPGDVTIRSPLALHRGTPNRSGAARPMVVMGYVRAWMNTPNVSMSIPRAYLDSLPGHLRNRMRCEEIDEVVEDDVETYVNFKF